MTRITIEVHNEAEEKRIREVLQKHRITFQESPPPRVSNGKQIAELLETISRGGDGKSISDPVAWQREVRKDRKLPFRD